MQRESSNAARRLAWGIPVLVVAVISLPLFTSRTFGDDWPDHLWLVWQQGQSIAQLGRPSYFLQSAAGVYQPFFAFYGGTFYAVTGGLSALLDQHPVIAFVFVTIAAFAGAYAGWTWLARQIGLRGVWAQLPGLLFVTSPYVITNPFGRGDVPEFIAGCSIPLVAASALAVLSSERLRARDAALLIFASAWFTACHNITALWGTTFLLATGVVLLLALWRSPRGTSPRRVLITVGIAAIGVAINAWYLFPTLAYSGRTAIAVHGGIAGLNYDTAGEVFSPLRDSREVIYAPRTAEGWLSDSGRINVQMPVLAFAWAAITLALAWTKLSSQWRRFAVGMIVIVGVLLALILTDMSGVPSPWKLIQFPFRAQTYVTLGVCGLFLVAVVAIRAIPAGTRRTVVVGALVFVVSASFVQAIVQEWSEGSSFLSRKSIFQPAGKYPASWYSDFDYADASLRAIPYSEFVAVPGVTVTGGNGESILPIPVNGHADTSVVTFPSPGQRPVVTNAYGGPEMIKVTGAKVIGRSPSNELVIEPLAPKGQEARVTFSTAHSFPIVAGKLVSIAALILCLVLGLGMIARRALRRANTRRSRSMV